MVARHIRNAFGIEYGSCGILRLIDRMNFPVRKRRPVPYNTATREELEAYVKEAAKEIAIHHKKGYKLFCFDAASIINSPTPKYGILPRGERDTVRVNHSKKGIHVLGALSRDSIELDYPENLKAESVIALFKRLHKKHGRIFVILDNAGAHKSKAMREYMGARTARWSCASCPRAPRNTTPSRCCGESSRGRYLTPSLADPTR